MTDIVRVADGEDLGVFDTDVSRAKNILSVQFGTLEYAQDLGIDLEFFLSPDFRFQNEAFRTYLIQVLARRNINVASVDESIQNLFTQLTFNLSTTETSTSLIAR